MDFRIAVVLFSVLTCLSCKQIPKDVPCGRTKITDEQKQIVGGRYAEIGEAPWQVNVYNGFNDTDDDGNWEYYWFAGCGGSIIDAETIITAGHCVPEQDDGDVDMAVLIGNLVLQEVPSIRVRAFRRHENYHDQNDSLVNDIAILKLAEPIQFDEDDASFGTVCLPEAGSDPEDGTIVTASGWGDTRLNLTDPRDYDRLRIVSLPIVDRERCQALYEKDKDFTFVIDETMICAAEKEGGKDSCQGDSGGPLVSVKDGIATLVGVVSYGDDCAVKDQPGVYAAVGHLRDWIEANRNF